MKIRKAILKDLKQIQELNYKLCKKELDEFDKTINEKFPLSEQGKEYFKNRIKKDNGFAYVAEDKGKIGGYLVGGLAKTEFYRNIKKIAEAENAFVLPEYRSKGIGSKLINEFIEWSKYNNVQRIRAVISALNHLSIKFHKKHGFEEYDIVMEKELK